MVLMLLGLLKLGRNHILITVSARKLKERTNNGKKISRTDVYIENHKNEKHGEISPIFILDGVTEAITN